MAIVFDSDAGTITGISVGGLPDGTVDNDTVASGLASSKLTGALPAISAASLTNVPKDTTVGGRKNILINGGMSVAQRGTITGATSTVYLPCDRWQMNMVDAGTWTYSQDTDVPAGQGFTHSLKMDCTTADTSVASSSVMRIQYQPEAQDLKQLAWGTSNAKALVMSFWIKMDNLTGDFCTDVLSMANSNNRTVSQKFTYSTAGTWQKCIFTIPADTGGNTLPIDNTGQTYWQIFLQAGSDLTTGTLNTTWATRDNTNRAAGQTIQAASSTSNNIYITGVQLELGSTATDFEYRSFGEELALCKRYFESSYPHGTVVGVTSFVTGYLTRAVSGNTNSEIGGPSYTVEKRAIPTVVIYHAVNGATNRVYKVSDGSSQTITGLAQHNVHGGGYLQLSSGADNSYKYHFSADAEL